MAPTIQYALELLITSSQDFEGQKSVELISTILLIVSGVRGLLPLHLPVLDRPQISYRRRYLQNLLS